MDLQRQMLWKQYRVMGGLGVASVGATVIGMGVAAKIGVGLGLVATAPAWVPWAIGVGVVAGVVGVAVAFW
jgi:hypothetical protein